MRKLLILCSVFVAICCGAFAQAQVPVQMPILAPVQIPAQIMAPIPAQITEFAPYEEVDKVILTPDGFVRRAVANELGKRLSHGFISNDFATQISRIVSVAYRIRGLATQPEDEAALNALQGIGKTMLELLGIVDAPKLSMLSVKRAKGLTFAENNIIEYKNYGSFNNKLTGFIQPISNAVYCQLLFNISKNKKVVFYGHITREGPLTGTIATEIWDRKGLCWKAQCAMDSLLVSKGSLPLNGNIKIGGMDPMGHFVEKLLVFPVKVYEE